MDAGPTHVVSGSITLRACCPYFVPLPALEPELMNTPLEGLEKRLQEALQDSPYLNQRTLRFETHDGRVVLRGEVASYYQKQMAQEAVRHIQGVHEIENLLEVNWSS